MNGLSSFYADLHIHIGRTAGGEPVKISAASNLTFHRIAEEAALRKGMDMIGIIDCHSPGVQEDMKRLLDQGEMTEVSGGGIRFRETTILLGCELEVKEPDRAPAHLLVYLPDLADMESFSTWIARYMKNVRLSSQRIYVPARELQQEVYARGGVLIPAHIFTPYKSVLGSAASRMDSLLDPQLISGVELGLSADTSMAGWLSELDKYAFVTNSDAHSLPKIGREYNELYLAEPSFAELVKALASLDGRGVAANYGLNPRLGKYHRTYCEQCGSVQDEQAVSDVRCPACGSAAIVRGVMDRIRSIADRERPFVSADRPPYRYQVPLEYIPGLGPKTINKLLARFGTEMNLLHRVSYEQLAETAGEPIARSIVLAREGKLAVDSGGGGHYGKVKKDG